MRLCSFGTIRFGDDRSTPIARPVRLQRAIMPDGNRAEWPDRCALRRGTPGEFPMACQIRIARPGQHDHMSAHRAIAIRAPRHSDDSFNMFHTRRSILTGLASAAGAVALLPVGAQAASASGINHEAERALRRLLHEQPKAQNLNRQAKAVLVFPSIVKAGFLIGGQTGDGVLRVGGKPVTFYNVTAASYGLQAGVQKFSYALFFMSDSALQYLSNSNGWTVGTGPSVVVIDKGAAASLTSTTLSQDVYAIPFGQSGLMAGVGIEGSKITQIMPSA
jgi:lipid-binding SYLF domain-containing protein